jgi:hypothetical protein
MRIMMKKYKVLLLSLLAVFSYTACTDLEVVEQGCFA